MERSESSFLLAGCLLSCSLLNCGIRIQLQHRLDVLQRILFHRDTLRCGTSRFQGSLIMLFEYCCIHMICIWYHMVHLWSWMYDPLVNNITFLNFIGLENTLKISIGHDRSRHGETLFILWGINLIKFTEGRSGPDTETPYMTTRSQFQQVQFVDW